MLTILLNVKMMINYNMSMLGLLLITIIYQVGDTPLHWAARGRGLDTAKLLIENGAHVNATNNVQYCTYCSFCCHILTPASLLPCMAFIILYPSHTSSSLKNVQYIIDIVICFINKYTYFSNSTR